MKTKNFLKILRCVSLVETGRNVTHVNCHWFTDNGDK